jgi:hypothetical protein
MKNKSSSTVKPVYSAQIEGAANTAQAAYNAQAPKISGITDQIGSLVPGLIDRYTQGDPNVKAAQGYNADVLGGKYLNSNPQLDEMVRITGNNTRNGLAASLGTRGLTGGSAFADIITRGLAENETGLRFNNYNQERARMDSAASMAPGLASAGYLPITAIQDIAQAQQMPVQTAAGLGSTIGGLLGQYTNQKQTQKQGLGGLIASLGGAALSGWAGGGFR